MATKALPSPEVLRQLLRYEPETGKLFWLPRGADLFATKRAHSVWNVRYGGKQAFTAADAHGYLCGRIFDTMHKAHRVIWAIQTGQWPLGHIDHVNCAGSDNRWVNLRDVTNRQNGQNRGANKNNAIGVKGVSWVTEKRKWRAQISVDGTNRHIGYFATVESAASAYAAASVKFHGEYGRVA